MNYKQIEELASSEDLLFYGSFLETIKSCQYYSWLLKRSKKQSNYLQEARVRQQILNIVDTLRCFCETRS